MAKLIFGGQQLILQDPAGYEGVLGIISNIANPAGVDTVLNGTNIRSNNLPGSGSVAINGSGFGVLDLLLPANDPIMSPGTALQTLPLVVVAGVNDTLVYTPQSTGVPETFTVAPGTYTTITDVLNAVVAATGSGAAAVLGDVAYLYNVVDTTWWGAQDQAGTTLTTGPTDVLADLGYTSPVTFIVEPGDVLGFWGATAVAQQTITGALSTVVDPAAKAVLTSLLAALSATAGYGLVIDGTT